MEKVVLIQPLEYRVSSDKRSDFESSPTGIRGGGGSYFHLIYGCVAGFCIWCIMEQCC